MAPPRPTLAQSESKVRFFNRLGLSEADEHHRRLYAMMKEEAVEGRRRMTDDEDSLVPQLRGDVTIEPPYSHAHVSETAIHREILRIYRNARPETKEIYDLGRDTDRVEEENWVIRWMLWHVFRYRDNRNRNRTLRYSSNIERERDRDDSSSGDGGKHQYQTGSATSPVVVRSEFYDPIRDG